MRLRWPPHDSAAFEVPVAVHRCTRGRGLLIQGGDGGNGMLIWLRPVPRDSATASYPLLTRGDSLTPRGAMVALRFMAGEIARGFALDSGAVTVANPRGTVSAQARGAGLDYSAGQRVSAEVAVGALPIAPDSAQCLVRL